MTLHPIGAGAEWAEFEAAFAIGCRPRVEVGIVELIVRDDLKFQAGERLTITINNSSVDPATGGRWKGELHFIAWLRTECFAYRIGPATLGIMHAQVVDRAVTGREPAIELPLFVGDDPEPRVAAESAHAGHVHIQLRFDNRLTVRSNHFPRDVNATFGLDKHRRH